MTAPHPVPPLVTLTALTALFFMLLAVFLPEMISNVDISSSGGSAPVAVEASQAQAQPGGEAGNVFTQPLTPPLSALER